MHRLAQDFLAALNVKSKKLLYYQVAAVWFRMPRRLSVGPQVQVLALSENFRSLGCFKSFGSMRFGLGLGFRVWV